MPPPLHDHLLFRSSEIDETRAFVGDVFCPHKLNPHSAVRRLRARMHHAKISRDSSLNFLKYGPEVTIEPGPLNDFFNVQVQLGGSVVTRCGSQVEPIGPGDAGILSPSEYASMDWARNSAMLIFSVSRKLVERKLRSLLQREVVEPVVFDTKMSARTASGAGWLRAVRFFQNEIDQRGGFFDYPKAIRGFEENLIESLLYAQQHNYSRLILEQEPTVAPAHVKRVENYILQNADQVITMEELTRISQTSARSLFAGYRKYRGISPMKFLRTVRLDRARSELQQSVSGASVTDIAGRWCFVQLGRFAADYKRRFGELPSETLRRSSR